jgi:hypothetical protein
MSREGVAAVLATQPDMENPAVDESEIIFTVEMNLLTQAPPKGWPANIYELGFSLKVG